VPICFMLLSLATVVDYGCQKEFGRQTVGIGQHNGLGMGSSFWICPELASAKCKSWLIVFAYMHNCAKHINSLVYKIS